MRFLRDDLVFSKLHAVGSLEWFVIGVALVVLELFIGELTFFMLGLAAICAAGVGLVTDNVALQAAAFSVSAISLLLFLKPLIKKHFELPTSLELTPRALIGMSGEVVKKITEHSGQIKLDGSIWSARSLDPAVNFQTGQSVCVVEIDGPTAVVWKESKT
ncbi:NfeD family protein [Corynebacterium diphtheriae]|nr:NfeD family protein [Corynebacterium diphtheriae]